MSINIQMFKNVYAKHNNSQQSIMLHAVQIQDKEPILHLTYITTISSNCTQYLFIIKSIKTNFELRNIHSPQTASISTAVADPTQ